MKYMLTSQARIFIAPKGAGCGREYTYYACMKMGGVDRQTGEATPVYCPDKSRPGRFKQVATVRGADSPWSSSIMGYKPLGLPSTLAKLAEARCKFDIQVHFGECSDLSDFGDYEMAIIFEDAEIADYNIDGLGALNGGEVQPVMETVNIKAANAYEIYGMNLVRIGSGVSAVGGQIAGVAYSPYSCNAGEAEECQNFFALQLPLTYGGNNGADHLYLLASEDGGYTWSRYTLEVGYPAVGEAIRSYNMVVVGDYVVISHNAGGGSDGVLISVPISLLDATVIASYSTATLGVTVNRLRRIGSRVYLVTSDGQVLWMKPGSLAPSEVEEDLGYLNVWYDIDGIDYNNIIVVGAAGTLAHRRNGASFRTVVVAPGGVTVTDGLTACAMKSATEWLVGDSEGNVYCTTNAGRTWTQVFSGEAEIRRINFPTKNVGYIVSRADPARIYKTTDGGNEWREMNTTQADLTDYSIISDIAVCHTDPSTIVVVGQTAADLADFGDALTDVIADMDGFILIGD